MPRIERIFILNDVHFVEMHLFHLFVTKLKDYQCYDISCEELYVITY